MSVGEGSFINTENFFDCSDRISIGNNVNIAMRCSFITSSHYIDTSKKELEKILLNQFILRMDVGLEGGNNFAWC